MLRGPLNKPMYINNAKDFYETFGKPNKELTDYFYEKLIKATRIPIRYFDTRTIERLRYKKVINILNKLNNGK